MSITLSNTPVLETERLILRAPVADDWPVWREFMLSDRAQFVRPSDIDAKQAWRAFGHFIGHWVLRGWGSFVITDRATGAPLGSCGPWFPEGWPEQELGWTIWASEAEGKGIAHEASLATRVYAYGVLGWETAVSYVDPVNARSDALAVRMGCTRDMGAPSPVDRPVHVWRHPAPADLADGGMEAYA